MDSKFRQELISIGIISYREQEKLYDIAKRCAKTTGIPMAGGIAVLGAGAGSVTIPGIGAIPGYLAGALAGLITGTMTCTALNYTYRSELKKLAGSN